MPQGNDMMFNAARSRAGPASAARLAALPKPLCSVAFLLAIVWVPACASNNDQTPVMPSLEPTPAVSPTNALATPLGTSTVNAETVVDLAAAEPLLTIFGADTSDFRSDLGALAMGDFNGDGFADVLAGARFGDGPDNGREDAGEAYVIFGSAEPPPMIDLASDKPDITIWGELAGDNLGLAAAAADLNGDDMDDIILGAPFGKSSSVEGGEPGKVYVIYGARELPSTIDLADRGRDATLIGATSNGFFGDSLASGDVNGDETADLIVGATFEGHSPSGAGFVRAGAAYVIYGGDDWPKELEMLAGDYDAVLLGAQEFDELGDNVASADLNGDGFDDVVATAEAADGPDDERPVAAEVHVLYGSSNLGGDFRIAAGAQDLSVLGADPNDTLGFDLAAADIDGDGAGDVAMGARLADGPMNRRSAAGEVHVLFGSSDPPALVDLADPPDGLAAYYGADASDFLGGSLATGDVDGDGTVELIMSAPFGDGPNQSRSGAGDVYVVSGVAPGVDASVDEVSLIAVIYGATAADKLGGAVATGDFSGDGRDELIVLAGEAASLDGLRPEVGRIYVLSLSP